MARSFKLPIFTFMRNSIALLFILITSFCFSQEVVRGLIDNPQIKNVYTPQASGTFSEKHLYLYKEAKQTLPFIDDFSSNRIKVYTTDTTSSLFSNTEYYYLYEVNSLHPDTIKYSTDTTFHYTIGKADSTANPTFNIYKYNLGVYPPVIYDTIKDVFPIYTIVDQSLGNPDTSYVVSSYVVNTLYLLHFFNDDNSLWTGSGVFENTNYPINPPSLGVATFDALDNNGKLYIGAGAIPRISDSLVSKSIDLSGAQIADNLFLSFYVESKGFGDAPEAKDTLVLQFLNASKNWVNVWTSAIKSSWPTDTFLQYFVPLNSNDFLHQNFKFRFFNYSSVSGYVGDLGNRDHWHLDYVALDGNRTQDDHYISDVAFVYPPKTLVNGYYNVPWEHFKSASNIMVPSSVAVVNNISNTSASVNFAVEVKEQSSSLYSSASAQNFTIAANDVHDFNENYGNFTYFSAQNDTAFFDVRFALNSSLLGNYSGNDTSYFQQVLSNYYAYDDATAEAGYGFYDAGAEFAYRFKVLEGKGDSLRGVWMYFNEVIGNTNYLTPFTFRVRNDNAGLPGTVLWESNTSFPQNSKGLNHFLYYEFDKAIFLKDSFYIGFHQTTNEYLNVGLDLNTISTHKMFYKTIGGWTNSVIKGSVMLHPVFGKKVTPGNSVVEQSINFAKVYPNPSSSYFFAEAESDFTLSVIDIQGKELLFQNCAFGRNIVSIQDLSPGIYIVKLINPNTQQIQFEKLVLQ